MGSDSEPAAAGRSLCTANIEQEGLHMDLGVLSSHARGGEAGAMELSALHDSSYQIKSLLHPEKPVNLYHSVLLF